MKIPKTIKTTLYLYKPPYSENILYSTTKGMDEDFGWEYYGSKEFDLDTPDVSDIDFVANKKEMLERKKQEIIESKDIAIAAIDDHLASLLIR